MASPPGPTCSKRLVRSAASGCPSKFMKRTEGTCGGCRASTAVRLNAGPPAGRAARDPSSLIQSALAQALQNCCRKWVSHRASMARHLGGRAHRGPGAAASACRRRPPGAAPRPRRTCAGGGGQAGGLYEPGPSSVVACAASCLQPTPLPLPPPLPAAPAARELTPASPSAGSCRAGRPTGGPTHRRRSAHRPQTWPGRGLGRVGHMPTSRQHMLPCQAGCWQGAGRSCWFQPTRARCCFGLSAQPPGSARTWSAAEAKGGWM